MTFRKLIRMLEIAVQRTDLEELYPDWINQALKGIQRDWSFNCMRHEADITITTATTFVDMPADFKELQQARPPIFYKFHDTGDDRLIPCDVVRQEELVRLDTSLLYPARYSRIRPFRYYPVYLSWNDGQCKLHILEEDHEEMDFVIKYYRYLPALSAPDDENGITRDYEEMVKAKVKAIAFEEIGDPQAADWETVYVLKLKAMKDHEAYSYVAGRRLQMGG